MEDPDAPTPDPFVHWMVYNIPAGASEITDGDPSLTYGLNSAGLEGWFGPCPPPGDGPHNYRFVLVGLGEMLNLEHGLTFDEAWDVAGKARLPGSQHEINAPYERQ